MSYEHYFINETKKQIVSSKSLYMDYEDGQQLISYLRCCLGDTIRIVGEEDPLVNSVLNSDPLQKNYEYKYIPLYDFKIYKDEEGNIPEVEVAKLYNEVVEK